MCRLGRFGDAVQVNQNALEFELSLSALVESQHFQNVKNWDSHNLHFLWFAALMDFAAAPISPAMDTARRLAKRAADGKSVSCRVPSQPAAADAAAAATLVRRTRRARAFAGK